MLLALCGRGHTETTNSTYLVQPSVICKGGRTLAAILGWVLGILFSGSVFSAPGVYVQSVDFIGSITQALYGGHICVLMASKTSYLESSYLEADNDEINTVTDHQWLIFTNLENVFLKEHVCFWTCEQAKIFKTLKWFNTPPFLKGWVGTWSNDVNYFVCVCVLIKW